MGGLGGKALSGCDGQRDGIRRKCSGEDREQSRSADQPTATGCEYRHAVDDWIHSRASYPIATDPKSIVGDEVAEYGNEEASTSSR